MIYAIAAPHSIAGSWMGLSAAILGWLLRTLATRSAGLKTTPIDLPLWGLFLWTVLSSAFSYEPQESLPKLINSGTFLLFYVFQSLLSRTRAVALALILVSSAVAGVVWSIGDLAVGRGVVITAIGATSPFRATPLSLGDAIWRVNENRVVSIEEIDAAVRTAPKEAPLRFSVISRGEHVEWNVPHSGSDGWTSSGLSGGGRTRSFRASGWTRHYETHAEVLQMLGQLALGLALALWLRGRTRSYVLLAFAAFALITLGIAFTAMRTVIVAFAIGALVVAWQAGKKARTVVVVGVLAALVVGALVVWRTRSGGALTLNDSSATSRLNIARVAANRAFDHPFLGHGMDAVHRHWQDWGFPGTDMLHAHSTPIQLAFDRGFPAVALWLWLAWGCAAMAVRAEAMWRDTDHATAHGIMLGSIGAVSGFYASSLVNYNFGDAEVTLLLWFILGAIAACARDK